MGKVRTMKDSLCPEEQAFLDGFFSLDDFNIADNIDIDLGEAEIDATQLEQLDKEDFEAINTLQEHSSSKLYTVIDMLSAFGNMGHIY